MYFSIHSLTNLCSEFSSEFSPDPEYELGHSSRDLQRSFPDSWSVALYFFIEKFKRSDTVGPVVNMNHNTVVVKASRQQNLRRSSNTNSCLD